MHPSNCPAWEYKHHANASAVGLRSELLLFELRGGKVQIDGNLRDTRPIHNDLFTGLTPTTCPYYAGHYRGEKYRCLRFQNVRIRSDSRVGVKAEHVSRDLSNLNSQIIAAGLKALEAMYVLPEGKLSSADKLNNLVVFSCRVLVEFFRIHPYVNGNGHIGRFVVWLILGKFGYWPKSWPLDESPAYGDLIYKYRDGDEALLHRFMLNCINGT